MKQYLTSLGLCQVYFDDLVGVEAILHITRESIVINKWVLHFRAHAYGEVLEPICCNIHEGKDDHDNQLTYFDLGL